MPPNEALKDTLSFVLFYYYQNWNLYSEWESFLEDFTATGNKEPTDEEKEARRRRLNKWLDSLMGDDSNDAGKHEGTGCAQTAADADA